MPPELLQLFLAMQAQSGSRELDYQPRDLPPNALPTPPAPTGLQGGRPPSMEDLYRQYGTADPAQTLPDRSMEASTVTRPELQVGGGSPIPGLDGGLENLMKLIPQEYFNQEQPPSTPRFVGDAGPPAPPERQPLLEISPEQRQALRDAIGPQILAGSGLEGLGAPPAPAPPAPEGQYQLPQPPEPQRDIGMDPTGTYGAQGEKIGLTADDFRYPPTIMERVHEQGWNPPAAIGKAALELPQTLAARISGIPDTREADAGYADNAEMEQALRLQMAQEIQGGRNADLGKLPEATGEYRLPQPPPTEEASRISPEKPTGAEVVAQEAADEADTAMTLPPQALQAGETDGDRRRAANEAKIGKLTALRSIAEGLGTTIPVKGEITQGVMPGEYKAKGIQEAIDRLSDENRLELQSGLRGEQARKTQATGLAGAKGLQKTGAGFAMQRLKKTEEMREEAVRVAGEQREGISKRMETQRQKGRIELLNKRLKAVGKKPLTDATVGKLSAMDHMERDLVDVLKNKHRFNTGGIQEMVDTALGWALGDIAIDPERGAFKAKLNNILAWYVRAVEGGRPSDADRRFLATVAPGPKDDDQLLAWKANELLSWVRENRKAVNKYLARGRTIEAGKSTIWDDSASAPALADPADPGSGLTWMTKGSEGRNVKDEDVSYWEGLEWERG